jgi:hypothetical protein
MRRPILILALGVSVVAMLALVASARDIRTSRATQLRSPAPEVASTGALRGARLETLWIFDADFEDLEGDNAGWTTIDYSGTLPQLNYWHHDTIRLTEEYLGESTWWCGTYDPCWRQPRGYGNDWYQVLERNMVEIEAGSPGDVVMLEWDQRYAIERNWDYGYVDVSGDGGATWSTFAAYTNTGSLGTGDPHDWDHPDDGHVTLDLSMCSGLQTRLRFRFDSDWWVSSEDEYDNWLHSMRDGAWQLDNITVEVDGSPVFSDDCESGNMGWIHDDFPGAGQTGVVFWRGQYGSDFVTGRGFVCDDRPAGSWMYAAVDPFTSQMVDGQSSSLISPPINIGGATALVGQWDCWYDCPSGGNGFDLMLASHDSPDCVTNPDGFMDEEHGWWVCDPFWVLDTDDWSAFSAKDWLAIMWSVWNWNPDAEHRAGIILNRQRVGVLLGDPGTTWNTDDWYTFHDWFQHELSDALEDSARVFPIDKDGIASLFVVASSDGGQTWEAYECVRENPGDPDPTNQWWIAPPPANQMTPGSEILYYYEATDVAGNAATYPEGAPEETLEMSILPITGSTADPGLLLVDKRGGRGYGAAGEDRRSRHTPDYYYKEALEILGFEFDVYHVDVPGSWASAGPGTSGMKYYDTQIWFAGDWSLGSLLRVDQRNLVQWLNQSTEGRERNLLITGNEIGRWLVDEGQDTIGFYTMWLASDYLGSGVGVVTVDSIPGLVDRAGGFDFLTHDDGECILAGGCPNPLESFDVVDAHPGVVGNEVFADYEREDLSTVPAGVAYTHPTMGYQTINLGFGVEYIMDGTNPDNPGNYTPEGYYHTGIRDRVALLGNIMEYFGLSPDGPGTDVAEGGIENTLSHARPNPFNPVTRIDYSVREGGPVSVEIYSVAGRVVRRLLDAELEAGASGSVVWDGTNDAGERCASGVYFYRIVAPGFTASRRMVLLK